MPYVVVKSAASYPNGIAIRSRSCPDLSVKVFQDWQGNTRRALLPSCQTQLYSINPFEDFYYEVAKKLTIILDIILVLALLFMKQFGYAILAVSFSLLLSIPLSIFLTEIYILQHTEEGRKNARFHAAEHKMVNAYRKYQKVPTIEQIKKASRYTTLCGSLEIIIPLFSQVGLYILLILSNELFSNLYLKLGSMLISGGIAFLLYHYGETLFQFFEIFLTKTPSNEELEISLEAIKGFVLLEQFLTQEISINEMEEFFDNAELTIEATES